LDWIVGGIVGQKYFENLYGLGRERDNNIMEKGEICYYG
jgi:hypothetical protein